MNYRGGRVFTRFSRHFTLVSGIVNIASTPLREPRSLWFNVTMPPSDPNQQFTPNQDQNAAPNGVVSPTNRPQPTSQQPSQLSPQQAMPDYDFIVQSTEKPKPKPFQNTAKPVKIAILAGGILVLLIMFNIVRGAISGPSVGEKFLSVAQDQQQIIVIATTASKQQGLSTVNANSSVTTQLGVATDQSATIEYMGKNGKEVKAKDLSLLLNSKVIAQLEASAAAGTYNETYKTVMSQELEAYMNHMSVLYKQTEGKNGRALLDSNYKSAKLLLQQLQAT